MQRVKEGERWKWWHAMLLEAGSSRTEPMHPCCWWSSSPWLPPSVRQQRSMPPPPPFSLELTAEEEQVGAQPTGRA